MARRFHRVRTGLRAAAGLVVAALFLCPLYVAFVTSVDTRADVFTFPPHLVPDWDFHPYLRVWRMARWLLYFGNTLFITGTTVALALATSVLAAFALSTWPFRGREAIFGAVLAVLMIPGEALLIPNYVILHAMGLLNTYWAQILPFGGSAFGIFLLRQAFLTIPRDFWDAARLDGAAPLWYLWAVALPQVLPTVITVGLYVAIGAWNSFQWPLIVTVSHNVQPLEVAVARLIGAHSVDWRRLSAAGVIVTVPLVALFLAAQGHIVRGIRRGEGIQ
jgi:multiple sugar transport system permease protein